jgi:hypothetical protein
MATFNPAGTLGEVAPPARGTVTGAKLHGLWIERRGQGPGPTQRGDYRMVALATVTRLSSGRLQVSTSGAPGEPATHYSGASASTPLWRRAPDVEGEACERACAGAARPEERLPDSQRTRSDGRPFRS